MRTRWIFVGSVVLFAGTVLAQAPDRECAACSDQINTQHVFAAATPQQKQSTGAEQQLDEFPKPVTQKMPVYPEEARKDKIEGEVYVEVSIDTAGRVWNARILKSSQPVLNQAALDAAKQWTFTPAVKDKKKVAITITMPFRFKLSDEEKSSKKDSEGYALIEVVTALLSGKSTPEIRKKISPEAYIIDKDAYINLLEVVDGRQKTTVFSDEHTRNVSFVRTTMNDQKDFATVVVKTEGKDKVDVRWHTVGWQKSKSGEWMIQQWHASR